MNKATVTVGSDFDYRIMSKILMAHDAEYERIDVAPSTHPVLRIKSSNLEMLTGILKSTVNVIHWRDQYD